MTTPVGPNPSTGDAFSSGLDDEVESIGAGNLQDAAQEYADDVTIQLLEERIKLANSAGDYEREQQLDNELNQARNRIVFARIHSDLQYSRKMFRESHQRQLDLLRTRAVLKIHLLKSGTASAYLTRETAGAIVDVASRDTQYNALAGQNAAVQDQMETLKNRMAIRHSNILSQALEIQEWQLRSRSYEESRDDIQKSMKFELSKLLAGAQVILLQLEQAKTEFSALDAAYDARYQDLQKELPENSLPIGPESDEVLLQLLGKLQLARHDMDFLQNKLDATKTAQDLLRQQAQQAEEQVKVGLGNTYQAMLVLQKEKDQLAYETQQLQSLTPISEDMSLQMTVLQAHITGEKNVVGSSQEEYDRLVAVSTQTELLCLRLDDNFATTQGNQTDILRRIQMLFEEELRSAKDIYRSNSKAALTAATNIAEMQLNHENEVARSRQEIADLNEQSRQELALMEAKVSHMTTLPPEEIAKGYNSQEEAESGRLLDTELLDQAHRAAQLAAQTLLDIRAAAAQAETEAQKAPELQQQQEDDISYEHRRRLAHLEGLGRAPDQRLTLDPASLMSASAPSDPLASN